MKLALVYNPCAGGGKAIGIAKKAAEYLESKGHDCTPFTTPASKEETQPDYKPYDRILLFGGDGTLHRYLNYWGLPELPLALISAGSGNDFSRLTTHEKHWEEQLDLAIRGEPKPTDIGTCNGVYFGTGVGIGFDGKVADMLSRNTRFKGFAAYMLAVITQIFLYREKEIRLHSDGLEKHGDSFMLTVGNTSDFGGGFKVTPHAQPDDGILEVCSIKRVSVWQRLIHLDAVTKGKHLHLRFVDHFNCKSLQVSCDEPLICHMDGETYAWTDFAIEVLPGRLSLIRP